MNLTLTPKNGPFGPQKPQNDQDLGQKPKLKLKEAQKIIFFSFMSRPQNNVENNHGQKKKAIWVAKSQNDPKIKTKLNVRIAGHQGNKSCWTIYE